jgi:TonB family protein
MFKPKGQDFFAMVKSLPDSFHLTCRRAVSSLHAMSFKRWRNFEMIRNGSSSLIVILIALLIFSLAGCGSDQTEEAEQTELAKETETQTTPPEEFAALRPPEDISAQDVDQLPVVIDPIDAEYPDTAKKMGAEGTVVLNLLIDRTGRVKQVDFAKHAESPLGLDKSAVLAARKSVWKPAVKDGRAVEAWVRDTVEFKLQ